MTDKTTACMKLVDCPRCSGWGYGEGGRDGWCQDCADTIAAKRPNCWRCNGTGRVQCEVTPDVDPNEPHLCSTLIEKNGATCCHCDKPTPPDSGCLDCWTPIPDNLADQKAMFAGMDLSLETPGA